MKTVQKWFDAVVLYMCVSKSFEVLIIDKTVWHILLK